MATMCVASGNGALPWSLMIKTWFTYENLYSAYLSCRKRKTNSQECMEFSYNLEENLLELQRELATRTYRPGRSVAFMVTKPKLREVFAAQFRDRVVHHLLYNYLAPIYEPRFIYDSWACRPEKGTHRAMKRLQDFTWQASEGGRNRECYYLQMDIKSFFTSIDKAKLLAIFQRNIKNDEILWLLEVIISYDPTRDSAPKLNSPPALFGKLPRDKSLFTVERGRGLPIGNLTSQFFANVYLNELDCFVKHVLKVKWYLRYVDDWVILAHDTKKLAEYERAIKGFLEGELGLSAKDEKTIVELIANGIDFVGYIIRPHYILVRRRVVWQWRKALESALESALEPALEPALESALGGPRCDQVKASYLGHLRLANTHSLLRCHLFQG